MNTTHLPTGRPNNHAADELLCPQCGFECTHVDVVDISTRLGTQRVGIDKVEFRKEKERGDRHTISLHISGECGHHTIISFQQHKGTTFVRTTATTVDDYLSDVRGENPVILRSPREA